MLQNWNGHFGLPVFEQIEDNAFADAFEAAMDLARARIAAVALDEETTFSSVIEALEMSDVELDRVAGLFYNLAGADSNETREALMRDLAPKLSAFSSELTNNKAIFAKIASLWEKRESLDLNAEQLRVLTLYYQMFVRAGARLEGDAAARLTAIKARLAVLGTTFSQNLLADERDWYMELGKSDLVGLPEFLIEAAESAGNERGLGPIITLSRSLIVPFLQLSPRRALREKAYEAWVGRGARGGKTDNREIAREILALRHERAQLLGYPDFATYKLEPEMAKTPGAVRELLERVWGAARQKALKDEELFGKMLYADGFTGQLQPWDWRYYAEQRRRIEHDFDEAALKPYLSLQSMLKAMFDCANRLFGLEFTPITGPFYHPDVMGWEVTRGGEHIAVFLGDYFARSSKRSGAWCSAMRSQRKLGGDQRPIVVNVCNFVNADPSLLSYDDARTLFHEFGHALHQMLSNVTYGFISGTSVARDFVELPSQLYEHWLEVPEVLQEHARHWQSNDPMPEALLEQLLAAKSFDQAFATVEFVASALVDLEFHSGEPSADPMQKQAEILEKIGMPAAIRMRHATPHFAHIFSGDGYSSGYYSYMWSEVMDADAFAAFEEAGDPFDPQVAEKLEKFILSAGGSQDAEALYLQFRGRMPGVEALLKGRGLLDPVE